MQRKINAILIAVVALLVFAVFENALNTEDFLPEKIINVRADISQTQPQWTLPDKLEEGKKLLRDSPPLGFLEETVVTKLKSGKKTTSQKLARKEIALAVLNIETGQVFEKRYWLDVKDIEKANIISKKYLENADNLPRFAPEDINEDFSVIVNWWNSFNSDLSIAKSGSDTEYIIAANKYLLDNDSLVYPAEKTGEKYSDIVYAPYSSSMHIADFILEGARFLNKNVAQGFKELEDGEIESKALPGKLITETITQTFVKNIFLTEQTDPRKMFVSDNGGRQLAERVFVRLGINKEKAFRYTVSKTGASGLGQIMPGTYASIVKKYPAARLNKDIDIGRVDIVNAIKASILVFDDHLATVMGKVNASSKNRAVFAKKTQDEIDEVRAAIYNGGPSKYKPLTGTIYLGISETVNFVKKFKMIRELKLFDSPAQASQTQP